MQGVYVEGDFVGVQRRPRSKKEVKEVMQRDPALVHLEATSVFGNEYDGPVAEAPDGNYTFVGPDPYTKRNFYGTIEKSGDKVVVK